MNDGTSPNPTSPNPDSAERSEFRSALWSWWKERGRSFFWRERELTAYEFLVVEILLARTRAAAVEPVAKEFLQRFSSPEILARAELDEVEELLRPLGLFRKRAAALLACADAIVELHGGQVPTDHSELLDLPYVGRYGANAIRCFARAEATPVVDANVARVFERYFALPPHEGKLEAADRYWELAGDLVSSDRPREHNWALLDLGAEVCTPTSPDCPACPLATACVTAKTRRLGDNGHDQPPETSG